MRRSNLRHALLVLAISLVAGPRFIQHTNGAPPTTAGVAASEQGAEATAESGPRTFSKQAKALPFPPDAREVEFDATFGDIEFTSRSSLASLAAFFRREMQKRGWDEDASAAVQDKDSVEMTFKHGNAQVVIELDQRSDGRVDVSMDCEGLDFKGADDPAGLLAAGVPQPRSYLYLQKEVPRPGAVRELEYQGDGCQFKSPMALQAAFDYYLKTLKGLGWRESRRPIITGDRRYTEFKRGPITLSVNIFSHEVGSRIILGYEDERQEPTVPPLPAVAAIPLVGGREPAGGANPAVPATEKQVVDVLTNAGIATVIQGRNRHVFKHVAAYQTKEGGEERTTLVFSDRPIPLQRMQAMLATKDDFSFTDLYEFSTPGSLRILVSQYTSFTFNAGAVGIGDGFDDPEGEIKIEQGRARGTIKMRQPKEVFDEPFQVSATIDAAVLTPNTRLGGAAAQPQVTRRESPFPGSELLLPDEVGNVQSEGSRYRKSTHAEIALEVPAIVSFYRTELAAQRWKEDETSRVGQAGDQAMLVFRNSTGKMTVKLQSQGQRTVIDVTFQDDAQAKRDGLLPEPGKARIVMANGHTRDVVIAIGKQDYPLKAGRGAQDPKTALNYSIAPGAYVITIKIPGEAPQTETLNITAGTTWGVLALPTGGYMASQLY